VEVDDVGVTLPADGTRHAPEVAQLVLLFIPYPNLVEEGMMVQEAFVAFTEEKIYRGCRIVLVQLFGYGGCEHHIAYEGGLDDEEAVLHEGGKSTIGGATFYLPANTYQLL